MLFSKEKLVPNEGQMIDPAHPAIYPTGVVPRQKLSGLEFKVYDLIVRRFLAAFGDPAVSRHINVTIDVNGYIFKAGGIDRKSTRLNSSHANISYAVFCLKKKKDSCCCSTAYHTRT